MTRSRYIPETGEWVDVEILKDQQRTARRQVSPNIISDVQPFKAMTDGEMIGSRSQYRENLKRNGCIEVGTDMSYLRNKPSVQGDFNVRPELRAAVREVMSRHGR